ncbi:MAG: low specificity L-threonine aldolase [Bacteroidales bacterium]|nr:low specificity L-threonine aldolase [Bacteroidales bacterium]
MRSLTSDNNSGVHPLILESINKANVNHAYGYGNDEWTREAEKVIRATFKSDCEPLFVFNGTGANIIGLQLLARSYHAILCPETAHIFVDECGSPTKMTGTQIIPIKTEDGKLSPDLIKPYLQGVGDEHRSQPGVISISETTELGTIYTPAEIKEIVNLAHQYGLYVHMDGSRLSNAAASLGVSLRSLTADCGIDVLSFGGTKNGLMMGECVIVFNSNYYESARYIRKQSAQLGSKMRFISCQFTSYLTDDLWLKNAQHANDMAKLLYSKLVDFPQVRFCQKVESNQLFLIMPRPLIDYLHQNYGSFYVDERTNTIRLVTSFDTTIEDVETFIQCVHEFYK